MFGFLKKDKGPSVHPMLIRQWAESLGTMTYNFRMHYVGLGRQVAMRQIRESWHGAEVADTGPTSFTVRHKERLEPFTFVAKCEAEDDGKIELFIVEAQAPISNVLICIDKRTTNYMLRCPPAQLNVPEKKLCAALEKHEGIPKGRWAGSDGQAGRHSNKSAPERKGPSLGPQGDNDSRPIIAVLVLGMAHIIRCRGEGIEKAESIIGPMWDIVRQNTKSDEKATEVVMFNLDTAFSMPAEAIPSVIQESAKSMSMTAKHEIAITLMWYSEFTDQAAGEVPADQDARQSIIKLYMNALGIPESDHAMLGVQARQRAQGAPQK